MRTRIALCALTMLGAAIVPCSPILASASGAATAAATSPEIATAPHTQTQTFTGYGNGTEFLYPGSANPEQLGGYYYSSGQLGIGTWRYDHSRGTPHMASFTRLVDGMTLKGSNLLTPTACGPMPPKTNCLTLDLHGTADIAAAHLVIAEQINDVLQTSFLMRGTLTLNRRTGYVIVDANGSTYTSGGIDHLGDAHTTGATDVELTPSGAGYWVVNTLGQIYAFGNAPYLGNANLATFALGEVVTAMSSTPAGKGYWLFTSKGRVIPFGDAHSYGDLHAVPLAARIVAAAATPSGHGYYLTAADGGVFAFGDAHFRGSKGGAQLLHPIVAIVLAADGKGYWLYASDGGVFGFNTTFNGSFGENFIPGRTIVAAGPAPEAYRQATNDGEVLQWVQDPGQVLNLEPRRNLTTPVVGIASTG